MHRIDSEGWQGIDSLGQWLEHLFEHSATIAKASFSPLWNAVKALTCSPQLV
jgi:hypothetical protein